MTSNLKKSAADSFESSMAKLEAILADLENSQISLGELVDKFEQAKKCLGICRVRLDEAELKIKSIGKDGFEDFSISAE